MNLLITGAFRCEECNIKKLEELKIKISFHKDEKEKVGNAELYDAVICNGLFLYNDIMEFKNLKIIQLTSAGLDRVPLEYCKSKNIQVFNAGNTYSIPMAEWCILMLLSIYKKTPFFIKNQCACKWEKNREVLELSDKNAFIVGFGNTGKEIAKRLKSFDVKITAVDVFVPKSGEYDFFCCVDNLIDKLCDADIVILTLPLNEKTFKMFNKNIFSKMKDGVTFVNISRGAIVNEKDLIHYIDKGKFLGVALDVFENEPLDKDSDLWQYDNVIITPHNSFVSDKNTDRLFNIVYDNLKNIIKF